MASFFFCFEEKHLLALAGSKKSVNFEPHYIKKYG